MRWLSVRSSRAISTLAISLTLTTTAAAAELPSQPPSPTPPPVPEPTQSHIRRQNTLVSPTQNAQEYAPTVTTTYAVMAQTDEDSPTPAAGADQAWNTVPVAAMMGLIMPNPDYDIYTGVSYTFGFIDYGSRYNEIAWGWLRETTPVMLGPGRKSKPMAFNTTGGTNVNDVSEGHQMCGAQTVWNFAHTYEIKFRDPGWYMLAVNNSYYQPEIRDYGRCHDPILYSKAFFATKSFSVKVQPTNYHLRSASSVTFWEAVSTETPPPVPAEKQGTDQRQKTAIAVGVTIAVLAVIIWTIFFFCYRHKLFHKREAVALNRMRPEERMQFFAENPTHCLNPARPPRWYQRHSPGQRAAMKGDWEEYRGWDWKNMPLPYPPMYKKKKNHSRKGRRCWGRRKDKKVTMAPKDTVVYTPVYYPGMADGRYNPQEQIEAANLHQYGRQARAEQQAYLEQQAQIQAILQQQHAQALADREAYIQYLRETESERQEYMEKEAEVAHAEYLQEEAEAQHAAWVHEQRMQDPEYRAWVERQQAAAQHQAYLQEEEAMRQARAAQKAAEAAGAVEAARSGRKSSYYTASQAYTEPMSPAEKIMSTYISQAQAHAAEVMRSQEIAQQQKFAQQPSYREPSPPPPPLPPKDPKPPSYHSPRRSRRH